VAFTAQARLDLDGFSRAVRAVALSPEGNLMAGASNSREIKIWETMEGVELVTMKGHDGDGLCVCTMDESGGCRCATHPGTRTDRALSCPPAVVPLLQFECILHISAGRSLTLFPPRAHLGSLARSPSSHNPLPNSADPTPPPPPCES
jgi:hypothetical protein